MLPSTPSAAITAPPGAPGAAIMVRPSMIRKGTTSPRLAMARSWLIIITAVAQVTMVMVEPDRWMVAHSGTLKSATSSLTPLALV